MSRDDLLPRGESLRRALRWMSDAGRHDAAAVEEAARRFDLTPAEEEFLLRQCRTAPGGGGQDASASGARRS